MSDSNADQMEKNRFCGIFNSVHSASIGTDQGEEA